ncbi:MAG: flagellar hook-associated protein FlgL [Gammaproteobacteria bacterium]|nr:flagellar hook-associated protein FlgL [Gammaproteobacteria bacterium]MBU1646178.1 flagellar hook-associated protein FlgL [Gammaproteobacteria bacterium]MBU1972240.1 flagellar hook-associated protein FlgL [Gammaproteobacteria bacterium]
MIRVSSGMIFEAGVRAINTQTASLLHLQQQVATGRRILTPADDPVSAARALEVTQAQEITAQYSTNHNNARSALGLEEAQLTSVNDMMARLKELTVQAGNAALSSNDRRSVALELRARFDELLGIANSTDGAGQFLFSGYKGSTKPFDASLDAMLQDKTLEVGYAGDDGQRRLQVSATRFLEVSDAGNDVFMRISNGNGTFATGYAAANTGTAAIDAGNVNDPALWAAVPAAAKQDVEVRFWKDTGVTGSLAIGAPTLTLGTDDEFMISVAGSPAATVTLPAGAYADAAALATAMQTAVDTALGVSPPLAGSAVVAADASGRMMLQSATGQAITVSAVTGNTGLATMFGTPTFGNGETYYDLVDVTGNVSLLTGATPPGPANLRRYYDGQAIAFNGLAGATADYGISVTISGNPVAGDSFSVKPSTSQSVFRTLANLIGTLESGPVGQGGPARYSNDIGFALTNLGQANENILRTRAAIGSRLNEVDSLAGVNSDLSLQYQQTLSTLQDLDYAKAISDLTRKQTDLEAAQQSFVRVSQLSLFNYL